MILLKVGLIMSHVYGIICVAIFNIFIFYSIIIFFCNVYISLFDV